MAEIFPFSALRYRRNLPLETLVTQPYDKITPQMQERYYAASPHNLVRIILGKKQAGDNGENVYTRAAGYLQSWRREGVLARDEKPSIYAYSQQFTAPGDGGKIERRGFIALGKLHDYQEGIVFRHEQTLSGPKADRLNLLRATRAHFGQIFMLYNDPQSQVEAELGFESPAQGEVSDEYGVVHRLWPISDAARIVRVTSLMAAKKLIIADGHHRYETALAYRNEQRAAKGNTPDAAHERVMMTFINMDSPGLLILPTHRVVTRLKPEVRQCFYERAAEFFSVKEVKGSLPEVTARLKQQGRSSCALLVVSAEKTHLLTADAEKIKSVLPDLSERQRALDVVVLHKVLLERVLGLSEESIRNQENISYYRDAAEAVARVRPATGGSGDFAFLMNPVRIEQMRDVAFAGEVMPQKSTDFYPKLLSGLAIYALD